MLMRRKWPTFQVQFGILDGRCEGDAAFVFLPEGELWRLLVQPDSKALQLVLYQLLVGNWFQAV